MSRYPTEITDEILNKLSRVSDETIERDIRDTKREINQLQAEYNIYRETTDRMESFRQLSRLDGVQQRRDFVNFLAAIMDKRKEKRTDKMGNDK